MNIVLTGMMATGKSSIGARLAYMLGMEFVDTDELIERKAGKSIRRIFAEEGETAFREIEKQIVKEMSRLNNRVIATGGGVVKDPENMEELEKNAVIICLKASPETICERTSGSDARPLLNVKEKTIEVERIIRERAEMYARCDLSFDTTGRCAEEMAEEISGSIQKLRDYADQG